MNFVGQEIDCRLVKKSFIISKEKNDEYSGAKNIWTFKICTVGRTVLHTVRFLFSAIADFDFVDVHSVYNEMKMMNGPWLLNFTKSGERENVLHVLTFLDVGDHFTSSFNFVVTPTRESYMESFVLKNAEKE